MNHAGSYTCVCPPSITGSTCEDSEWMDRYLCICLPLNVVMYLTSQGYGYKNTVWNILTIIKIIIIMTMSRGILNHSLYRLPFHS